MKRYIIIYQDCRITYHLLNPSNESIVDLSISQRDGIIIFVEMDNMALSTKLKQNGERFKYSWFFSFYTNNCLL